jgi:cyclopropane fatty-acyl-phospholipid synthase-like methyltransferase
MSMNKQEIALRAKGARRIIKDDFLLSLCKGKKILDVGCIGQDREFTSQQWLHNKVKNVAASIDGVDIIEDQIIALRLLGYSMFNIDELKEKNDRYDMVLMSDVIEHVDNPVEFLRFYSMFLKPDGLMFVSTPNSNRANNFINILFNNNYSVNPEHVFWFCPRTLCEVTDRASLQIKEFHWADHYYSSSSVKGLYQKLKFSLINLLIAMRSNFSPNMIFVINKGNSWTQKS